MEVATHIEALRREGELMAAATAVADADAAVPTCPEWRVRDLVRHTGGVHRWATGYVADARTEVWDIDLDDVVGSWPEDSALADVAARRMQLAGRRTRGGAGRPRVLDLPPSAVAASPCGRAGRRTRRPSIASMPSWRRASPEAPSRQTSPPTVPTSC